jgi:hypothetical protein
MVTGDDILVTAFLEQLQREENPWDLLAQVQKALDERKIGISNRHECYKLFTVLVATMPRAEEDAVLVAGKKVFTYRLDTARADVAKLRDQVAGGPQRVTSFCNDELAASIIHVPGAPQSVQFALYYHADGRTDTAEELKTGGVILVPPQSTLVDGDDPTLLLPSAIEEYGTSAALFERIGAFLDRVVAVPDPAFRTVASAYVLMSWVFDRFDAVPYLRFLGDSGGGKSRAVAAVGHLCYRGALVNGAISAAALFRLIEVWAPTLCIDEADLRHGDSTSDIVKVINAGYSKGGHVIRCAGEDFEPTSYNTFGPKVIGTRERFQDVAVESRCLTLDMPRSSRLRAGIPLNFTDAHRAEAATLRNQCLMWRFRNARRITVDAGQRLAGLDPRLNQILLPLLSVVAPHEAARGTLLDFAGRLGSALQEERLTTLEARLLAVLVDKDVRPQAEREGFWSVGDVTTRLNRETPAGDHVGTRTVGRKLRHFGFQSDRDKRTNLAIYRFNWNLLRERLDAYGFPWRTAAN